MKLILLLNKYIWNPLVLTFAGKLKLPLAKVVHYGRKSGKRYQTPIIVHPTKKGFLVSLPYGPNVQWYKNIQATQKCTIIWNNKHYHIQNIQRIEQDEAMRALPTWQKTIIQLRQTRDFLLLST